MTKPLEEKFFDVRTVKRYLKKGLITESDVKTYHKNLPNDETNFDLVMVEEDDIGIGDSLSDEELDSMPEITEDNIDDFEFLEKKDKEKVHEDED